MADLEDSIASIKASQSHSTPVQIMLDMILATSHDQRAAQVERAVDWVSQEFVKTSHIRQTMGEDLLTIEIITSMKAMGFDAAHDTQYGGHCDIVVEARDDFLWIAEAKIHKGYDWLLAGFEQLDRRYSTGLAGQDTGEMIIYCFVERADLVLSEYQSRLTGSREDVKFDQDITQGLFRRSVHTHVNTGRDFRVRHSIVPLYFSPVR
ncbi:hypothetical protein N2600_18150 [Rhizobium sp. WSM1274]|uniref:hypothetical protein n=1 Tax=Rhizobium sp. WSM1274 TaxID=3138254 RepID=UPI0021A974B9|nr:hypothetical protein [Rhizobium leguminosarum]UWU27277.1 hypothetical protein N2600_18150 [Rhizobium leguminosarum bv. viciae]